MDDALALLPLLSFVLRLDNFTSLKKFCLMSTVSKAFHAQFVAFERSLYLDKIRERTAVDISQHCDLEELRRFMKRNLYALSTKHLFSINKAEVFDAVLAQGRHRAVDRETMLYYAVRDDSHVMFERILCYKLPTTEARQLQIFEIVGGNLAYKCFLIAERLLKLVPQATAIATAIETADYQQMEGYAEFIQTLLLRSEEEKQ